MALARSGVSLLFLLAVPFSALADPADDPTKDQGTRAAVEKGLKWLADKQNADGSWSDTRFPSNTGITACALRAFMANGHWPGEGKYKENVAKGMKFLLTSARPDGYLIGARGGNMYCHGLATQALAELYAKTKDKAIEPVLGKAVKLILSAQSKKGGWRYEPRPTSEDISITTTQVVALQAAKKAGIEVPDEVLKKGLDYVRSCADPATGGYVYMAGVRSVGFGRTAAGLHALQACGEFKPKDHVKSIEYLKKNLNDRQFFFYGHAHAVHLMKAVGGEPWEEWRKKVRKILLEEQSGNGSWSGSRRDSYTVGPMYHTSLAVLILSVLAK